MRLVLKMVTSFVIAESQVVPDTIPWEDTPYGVVSLADLITYNIEILYNLAGVLGRVQAQPFNIAGNGSFGIEFLKKLAAAQKLCMDHGWLETAHQINQIGEYFDDQMMMPVVLQSKCSDLEQHILRVLKENLFFHAESNRLKEYWECTDLSKEWKASFPLAYLEMFSTHRCYLYDEPTAAVFHSMRALEIGLRAFAKALNAPMTTRDQWEVIINNIEVKIKEINGPHAGLDWKEKQSAYSEVALHFRYLKNGWRNHVTHSRTTYEAPKALQIVRHVSEFLRELKDIGLKEPLADALMKA